MLTFSEPVPLETPFAKSPRLWMNDSYRLKGIGLLLLGYRELLSANVTNCRLSLSDPGLMKGMPGAYGTTETTVLLPAVATPVTVIGLSKLTKEETTIPLVTFPPRLS